MSTKQFGLHGPNLSPPCMKSPRYDYVQKTNEGCFVQLATLDTEKPILFLGHLGSELGTCFAGEGALMIRCTQEHGMCQCSQEPVSMMMVLFKKVSKNHHVHVEWKLAVLPFPGRVFFSFLVGTPA